MSVSHNTVVSNEQLDEIEASLAGVYAEDGSCDPEPAYDHWFNLIDALNETLDEYWPDSAEFHKITWIPRLAEYADYLRVQGKRYPELTISSAITRWLGTSKPDHAASIPAVLRTILPNLLHIGPQFGQRVSRASSSARAVQ